MARWAGAGLIGTFLFSPLWGFEALYQWGIHGETLPTPAEVSATPNLMQDALWIATGEVPGRANEPLWLGNFFRLPSRSHGAAVTQIARSVVYRDPSRRTLDHHLRLAAVTVWLTRHATEGELKQSLAQSSFFGRNASGASDAAATYFGRPVERLTIGEVALLAGLTHAPSRLDPSCHPERAERRRAYVLARLRDFGRISPSDYDTANAEPLNVLPSDVPCDESP